MARVTFRPGAIQALYDRIGDRLKTTTERVVEETADLPVEEASRRLQHELKQIGGSFSLEQCRGAVETMRAGKVFTFHLK